MQRLQGENSQLREDVQYLQHLLSVWQPQACCICQLHATTSSSKGTRSRAAGTHSRDANGAAYAAVDRMLRQQQVMVAQQQRQLLALQVCHRCICWFVGLLASSLLASSSSSLKSCGVATTKGRHTLHTILVGFPLRPFQRPCSTMHRSDCPSPLANCISAGSMYSLPT